MVAQDFQHGAFADPAAIEQRVHHGVVHEGGAALVHHLRLPLRVEILGDDPDDPEDLALPGFEDQAGLLQEIEQVLLGQVERLLALGDQVRVLRRRLGAIRRARKRAPQIVVGPLLIFQPLAQAFALLLGGETGRSAIAEHALVH